MLEKLLECLEMKDKNGAADELKKSVSLEINSYCFNAKENAAVIFDIKEASASFAKIAAYWICALNFMSKEKWRYDDRNRYAVEMGNKIIFLEPVKKFISETGDPEEIERILSSRRFCKDNMELCFVMQMMDIHRTLQQTFSKTVFYFLDLFLLEISQQYGIRWMNCPMI